MIRPLRGKKRSFPVLACGKPARCYEINFLAISTRFDTPHGKLKVAPIICASQLKLFLIESIIDNIALRNLDYLVKQIKECFLQPSSLKMASHNSFAVLFAAQTFCYHVDMIEIPLFSSLLLITLQYHT